MAEQLEQKQSRQHRRFQRKKAAKALDAAQSALEVASTAGEVARSACEVAHSATGAKHSIIGAAQSVTEGCSVQLVDLLGRKDLNGSLGVAKDFHAATGRWSVKVGGREILVKASNLRVVPPAPTRDTLTTDADHTAWVKEMQSIVEGMPDAAATTDEFDGFDDFGLDHRRAAYFVEPELDDRREFLETFLDRMSRWPEGVSGDEYMSHKVIAQRELFSILHGHCDDNSHSDCSLLELAADAVDNGLWANLLMRQFGLASPLRVENERELELQVQQDSDRALQHIAADCDNKLEGIMLIRATYISARSVLPWSAEVEASALRAIQGLSCALTMGSDTA